MSVTQVKTNVNRTSTKAIGTGTSSLLLLHTRHSLSILRAQNKSDPMTVRKQYWKLQKSSRKMFIRLFSFNEKFAKFAREGWGARQGLACSFLKIEKKCPGFRKKYPDWVFLRVKCLIWMQFQERLGKNSFTCGAFLWCVAKDEYYFGTGWAIPS